MSDINQMMIKEINAAIDEGKSALVHEEISIAELEKKLLEKRVYLTIGHTALAALIAKRDELRADQAPPPPAPEPAVAPAVAGNVYFFAGNAHEKRSPRMPEGRTVENPAVDIQRDASERILNMFDQPDSAICYSVAQITEEVYGVSTPHNLKKCAMRLCDLQRKGKVVFNRPISAATTLVHKVP